MLTRRLALTLAVCAAACAAPPAGPVAMADLPNISTDAMLADIKRLSADEFEGRAPGTKGEQLTVQYLIEQLRGAGMEPGNPDGTWTQRVPLVGLTPQVQGPFVVKKGGVAHPFRIRDQIIAFSKHVTDEVKLENSELVFAGYGVQAPEFQWDDFKDVDVKGKTLIVLVNDPPVVDADGKTLDGRVFRGNAMTYYGRWTYKFEKAAEMGAAGVLVVHETAPAGYPFSVVQGMGGERFDLVTPDKNAGRAKVEGWMSMEAATAILKLAGQDYQKLKALAATRQFKAVPLGLTGSVTIKQSIKTVDSQNVIGKLTGSDATLKNEYIVYTAHWDHLGVGDPVNGDSIYNGALDNASGCAMMLEIAREMTKLKIKPKRSILFLFVTAEEQGLLGSQYYAEFPLYPLAKTIANINIDGINQWGRTSDLTVIGLGNSELDDYARDAASEQSRVLRPDAEPEKGFYYRSDHFNFAKKGVPAFDPDAGTKFTGKPDDYGTKKRDEYTSRDYHAPSDHVKPDWDLGGAADDAKLFLAMGFRLAQAARFPEWRAGNEFKAARDRMLGK
jgi:Zn-dependent M28 family amino/carboxypeptidase